MNRRIILLIFISLTIFLLSPTSIFANNLIDTLSLGLEKEIGYHTYQQIINQKEIVQLATEITRIANDTEFNAQKLLNGGITSGNMGESTFHIGANAGQNINISISAMDAKTLGVARDVSTATATGAGIVTGATVNEAYGPAVTDGEVVTLTYAAGTAAKAATNATKTAEADLGVSIAFNTAPKIVINGTDVTLNAVSALGATFDGAGRIAEVVTALQTDIDSAIGSSVYTVGYSGSKLTITDVYSI